MIILGKTAILKLGKGECTMALYNIIFFFIINLLIHVVISNNIESYISAGCSSPKSSKYELEKD